MEAIQLSVNGITKFCLLLYQPIIHWESFPRVTYGSCTASCAVYFIVLVGGSFKTVKYT